MNAQPCQNTVPAPETDAAYLGINLGAPMPNEGPSQAGKKIKKKVNIYGDTICIKNTYF